ncbi:MAG TPA: hypothetical protein VN521_03330, partial [Negativicutes bacterium]|nr:hypothetical protein [Negativicutes bacterium]
DVLSSLASSEPPSIWGLLNGLVPYWENLEAFRRRGLRRVAICEGRYAPLTRNAANDTARAAMDGGENRQMNMDVILAVARRSRPEYYGAFVRSIGAKACGPAKGGRLK